MGQSLGTESLVGGELGDPIYSETVQSRLASENARAIDIAYSNVGLALAPCRVWSSKAWVTSTARALALRWRLESKSRFTRRNVGAVLYRD